MSNTKRVAVVTGGAKGIGKAVVERLAHEGHQIAVLDTDEEALRLMLEGAQGYEPFTRITDISRHEDVKKAVAETVERFGRIDILVNNAGVIRDNLLFKMSDSDWDTVMDVHLKGAFLMSREVQTFMVHQKHGRIINLSSTSALGNRGQANYSTAKAGLQGLTKTLAVELGPYGITVNAVAPGFIETDMTRQTAERIGVPFEEFVSMSIRQIPARRSGQPEDVANAVAFFADERSSYVNGQILYVSGGPAS
ncbi:3-oxoacyl-ACP reductase [Rossellomorea marisflavi]|uniref:3-oxoacyl-ACP reductase n=1 Tax=Rossellomorea marisflavi TaxID=189381 RepID=A0A0M0GPK4_9BACI|nr:3-oxoacyl-ACP reductase FabG [Rossellomorea marisflavi]KON91779.1 3-oxoacyl-ACP reductase [Rossellomorea marisflavi]MCM2589231.1 3-oxoacyl-ACP reductase FabG [Rossellomorea marisflavi]